MKIHSARVSSADASVRTLRDRTRALGGMRNLVSRGSSVVQLSQKIAAQTPEHRDALLNDLFKMPGKFIIQIPSAESLALKSDLQLPWAKLREMRQYIMEHACMRILEITFA